MSLFRKGMPRKEDLWLIAGLGNPGHPYTRNRHNAGFMAATQFVKRHEMGRGRRRYAGRWREGEARGFPVAVLLPQTFMNHSGVSIAEAVNKKHVPIDRLIVIHDDLDFPFGKVRCRRGGGTGGHNGLESVVAALGTSDFHRVRVGIGRPDDPEADVKDWVLSDLDAPEEEIIEVMNVAADCAEAIITEGIEAAMARFNRR